MSLAGLLAMLQLADSGFPSGRYTLSHGLESFAQSGALPSPPAPALTELLSNAVRFGYRPQCKSEDHREQAMAAQAKLPPDPVGDWYHGGPFCSDEFTDGIEQAPT